MQETNFFNINHNNPPLPARDSQIELQTHSEDGEAIINTSDVKPVDPNLHLISGSSSNNNNNIQYNFPLQHFNISNQPIQPVYHDDSNQVKGRPMNYNAPVQTNIQEMDYIPYSTCCMFFIAILFFWTLIVPMIILSGFHTVLPNQSLIITKRGQYIGTLKKEGLYWIGITNEVRCVSLAQSAFWGTKLKVNDKEGYPIEINCGLVIRIVSPVLATFSVQNYNSYIHLQTQAVLKEVASKYKFNVSDDVNEKTLVQNIDEINQELKQSLNEGLEPAGIICDDCALIHLSLQEEHMKDLLKRQEAEARIEAKQCIINSIGRIVGGCVNELEKGTINLTEEERTDLISKLTLIVCEESENNQETKEFLEEKRTYL